MTCVATGSTGKERDSETGLDYFGARYFSGAQGRFTSPDPQFFQKEMLGDPQRFNLYAYARNNPLKFIDPSGEAIELSTDPAEREKQMQALCGLVGNDTCKQYLYVDDKYKKGHYYVGIYAGGQSGKGPDFGSLNGVTAGLQEIIRDPHVGTVDVVQGSDRIQMPPGYGPSLNINHADGATTPFMNGQIHVYVRAQDDPRGYDTLAPWKMSNWWFGERDQNTVLGHELGHMLYRMKSSNYNESSDNKSAVELENKVRVLKNPNAATRTRH